MTQVNSLPLPDLDQSASNGLLASSMHPSSSHMEISEQDLDPVLDVPITVTAILGRTRIPIADIVKLDEGSIVELDKSVGEPVEIVIDHRLVARGEVVLVNNQLAITLTEIVPTAE
jgi:flagellar motor switch protein FliN